jgi:hypothetical protein
MMIFIVLIVQGSAVIQNVTLPGSVLFSPAHSRGGALLELSEFSTLWSMYE